MEPSVNQTDRTTFLRHLEDSVAAAERRAETLGLVIVQIENYERVAAAFGSRVASSSAVELATRLRRAVRSQDDVTRIGESKFAVVIRPLRNPGMLILAANKISSALARPARIGGHDVTAAPRLGMSVTTEKACDAESLLQHAETALLTAHADDQPYALYSPALHKRAGDSLGLEVELEKAIQKGELELHYQPKIAAADFTPCGAEALLRWTSATRGPISPEVFVPLADKIGRTEQLTSFVLNTALRQSAEWPRHWGRLSVAVNVTPRALEDADFAAAVDGALGLWDTPPDKLFIEITEGAIMRDPQTSFRALRDLRALGVQISIDDFGTGYSSLAYFKNIPADELKVDKSFVSGMLADGGDRQIVRTIVELSKRFGLRVTAEGVEDLETATALAALSCDRLQGYHYSKPVPHAAFIAWLDGYARRVPPVAPAETPAPTASAGSAPRSS